MFTTEKSSILLPHFTKQNAQADPNGVFARVPAGTKYTDGYKDVSKLQFHNAINHTAALIRNNLGGGKDFETLAYIGPGDLRYSIIVVAGMKAGYKVRLFSSMSFYRVIVLMQFEGLFAITKEQHGSARFTSKEVAMHETHHN